MKFTEKTEQGRLVLMLAGDVDGYDAEPFVARVEALIDAGCRELFLDLARVRFMSSRGVRVLLQLKRSLELCGGALQLLDPSDVARWTLATLGVEHVLIPSQCAA